MYVEKCYTVAVNISYKSLFSIENILLEDKGSVGVLTRPV